MGGERQHYIPRLLLRGFASNISKDKVLVWYFRKGEDPIEVSTKDIALEKNFYGKPGEGSLDETITDKEKDFANAINRARKGDELTVEEFDILIRFVENLIIRTRHLRKGLTQGVDKLSNMFINNISDPGKVSSLLKNEDMKNMLRRSLEDKIGTNNPTVIEGIIRDLEKNPEKLAVIGKLFARIFKQIDQPKEMTSAHKKAMTRLFDEGSSKRINVYLKLNWQVKSCEIEDLILGDVGVLKLNIESGEFSLPISNVSDNSALILPISKNKLLVGSSKDDILLPSTDRINRAVAEHSMDFIIASNNGETERGYSKYIGTRTEYLDDQTLDELEQKHFGN